MIGSLSIQNFLLIDDQKIDFQSGFTAITGETGAGKSILLEALALLLGKRVTDNIFQNKDKKCVIEAEFDLAQFAFLEEVFQANDLDYSAQTLIRREISANGRSRLFINDTPTTLQVAQQLSPYLIDIHSQDGNSILTDEGFWFRTLDIIAQNEAILAEYSEHFKVYKKLKKKITHLTEIKDNLSKEADFKTFQLEELINANLEKVTELTELESELTELSNAEFVIESLDKIRQQADADEVGITSQLHDIGHTLSQLASKVPSYSDIHSQFEQIQIEFKEWLRTVPETETSQDHQERLDIVNQRLAVLYALLQKHKCTELSELIDYRDTLQTEVDMISGDSDELSDLIQQSQALEQTLHTIADNLKTKRQEASTQLLQKLTDDLKYLAMEDAEIQLEFNPLDDFTVHGKDSIQILVRTNLGTPFGELAKTTSGGEKSRLIFALKHILSEYKVLPTIIFDEVDTGISGKVSEYMGKMMKNIGQKIQLISITHSPQIAASATTHYKVSKSSDTQRTTTEIHRLTANERINEIASMVSGQDFSEHAINHAKELLNL